jgi:hypothetical protein
MSLSAAAVRAGDEGGVSPSAFWWQLSLISGESTTKIFSDFGRKYLKVSPIFGRKCSKIFSYIGSEYFLKLYQVLWEKNLKISLTLGRKCPKTFSDFGRKILLKLSLILRENICQIFSSILGRKTLLTFLSFRR